MDSEKRCDNCGASSDTEEINSTVTDSVVALRHTQKGKSAGNIVLKIVSAVLAVILCVFAMLAGVIGAVGSQLTDYAIDASVSGLEMFDYVNATVKLRYTDGTELRFAEMIYRTVDPNGTMPDSFESELADVLNSQSNETALAVRVFASKKARGFVRDIRNQTAHTKITAEEIVHLVKLLRDEMRGDFGDSVSDGDADTVVSDLNKFSIGGFTVDSFKNGNETLFDLLGVVMADTTFYVMIAICIVLIGFILAINVSKIGRGILMCGISLLVAGTVSAVGSVLFEGLVINGNILQSSMLRGLIDAFSDFAVDYLRMFGIIVSAVAIVTSAVGVTVLAVSKKRRRTKCVSYGGDRQ